MYKARPSGASSQVAAEKFLSKSLPFSMEAERSVIGAVLLHDQRFEEVLEIVGPNDFYVPTHRTIVTAMAALVQRRQRIDLITLSDELQKSDALESCGGMAYLISLQEDIPAVGLLEAHARIIKEKSILRELIGSATTIISNCYNQNDRGIDALVDEAEKTIFNISAKQSIASFVQLNIWLKKTFQALSEIKGQAKGITGISTGYKKLDEMTSGFQKSDLIILAARPSMGKTAISLALANHAAREGMCVGFFSLEMAAEQLTVRLLSCESRVPHHSIRNATITSDEWVELTDVAARMAERRLFIDDVAMQSIMDVRAKARRLKAEHGLDFLIIDYLQLINSTHKKFENRHQEVSDISRSLKALAKELNIPIVALSQLSRAVDSRVDKRPLLSDLRESGAIEQDADLIMFLYRDIVYNADTENPALSELIIGKQRNGPTGTVYLHYERELTLFEDMEQPQ